MGWVGTVGWGGLELWVGLELWELWKIWKILDFCDLLGTSGWNFGVGTGKFHSTQSSNPEFATVPEASQNSPKFPKGLQKFSKNHK
jgi:hypothetical protein